MALSLREALGLDIDDVCPGAELRRRMSDEELVKRVIEITRAISQLKGWPSFDALRSEAFAIATELERRETVDVKPIEDALIDAVNE